MTSRHELFDDRVALRSVMMFGHSFTMVAK